MKSGGHLGKRIYLSYPIRNANERVPDNFLINFGVESAD